MKYSKIIAILTFLIPSLTGFAQMTKATGGNFALTNATVVTVSGAILENSTVVISEGKIAQIGTDISLPANTKSIDCTGLFIYPGMIDGGTNLGLVEVGSLSETQDNRELGSFKPHIQALTAINPNSVAIPVTRVGGVTTVISNPEGGMITGTSALINLYGYTPEQMYAGFKGLRLNFPTSRRRGRRDNRSEEDLKKELDKALESLNEVWDKAEEYVKINDAHLANSSNPAPEYYAEMEAMVPVIKGTIPVLIEVNSAKDIVAAISWVEERKVRAIFTGVSEGWRVADDIAKSGIPVVAGPILSMPTRSSDRYDKAYANPGLLAKAGVKVALRSGDTENVRNLPFHAGFAAAYGMGKEEALKAVTLNSAEIFGVSDMLGSIDVGKSANLLVTDGDPFEPSTTIKHVFISGWQMPIDSRHIRLYDEFLDRSLKSGR